MLPTGNIYVNHGEMQKRDGKKFPEIFCPGGNDLSYLYCWKETVFSYLSSFSPLSATLLSRNIDIFCSGGICSWIFYYQTTLDDRDDVSFQERES